MTSTSTSLRTRLATATFLLVGLAAAACDKAPAKPLLGAGSGSATSGSPLSQLNKIGQAGSATPAAAAAPVTTPPPPVAPGTPPPIGIGGSAIADLGKALGAPAAAPAGGVDGWVPYSDAGGQFSAWFPGNPEVSNEPTEVPNVGTINLPIAMYTDDAKALGVVGVPFALRPDQTFDAKKALEGGRDGALKGMGLVAGKEHSITSNGLHGIEVECSGETQGQHVEGLVRIFAGDHPVRVLMAIALFPGARNEAIAAQFLDHVVIK